MFTILRLLSFAALLLLPGCGGDDDASPPAAAPAPAVPVVVIGLDTVRADHLGCYGNGDVRTPHLDALAADGVLFAAARTTAPWTGPSFASLFTGLLPYRHGFLGGDYGRLVDEHATLAEILGEQGYPAEAHVTVKWLTKTFGMHQGFQRVKRYYQGDDTARTVTVQGLRFAERHRDGPFFLFMHYFDAHAPYTPPAPFDRMYYEGDPTAPGEPLVDFLRSDEARQLDAEANDQIYDWLEGVTDWDYPTRQYAAGVSFVDEHVGRVVAKLKELGVYERAFVIAVGDHGEHLGEHGFWFTHALPYEETMRVPLLVKFPGGEYAGTVVPQGVSLTDVLPTVLAELGLETPADLDGRDLAPLFGRPDAAPVSPVIAEQGRTADEFTKTIVDGTWKLHFHRRGGEDVVELFDLAADPGETADLASSQPEVVERLATKLWAVCAGESPLTSAATSPTGDMSKRDKARLKSLGYTN